MMGLYLAVFVHRDAKPLVRGEPIPQHGMIVMSSSSIEGTSKSAVTTGLIGGRVGNKGGVGVSMNLAGTTLLFINAHLAGEASLPLLPAFKLIELCFQRTKAECIIDLRTWRRLRSARRISSMEESTDPMSQAELSVDDYLSPNDPRFLAEGS